MGEVDFRWVIDASQISEETPNGTWVFTPGSVAGEAGSRLGVARMGVSHGSLASSGRCGVEFAICMMGCWLLQRRCIYHVLCSFVCCSGVLFAK